jgi:hypothetical protein
LPIGGAIANIICSLREEKHTVAVRRFAIIPYTAAKADVSLAFSYLLLPFFFPRHISG